MLTTKKQPLFIYLLLLTTFLFLLEISFFLQCNSFYFSDFTLVADYFHIPATIIPGVLFFVTVQIGIHFFYAVLIWLITIFLADLFKVQKPLKLGIYLWLLGLATILTANQYYFPNSKFVVLTSLILITPLITKIIFNILLITCLTLVIFAFIGLIKQLKIKNLLLLTMSVCLIAYYIWKPQVISYQDASSNTRPNIIIIGMDSLRPDFLNYFGDEETHTPFIDHFLNHASVFAEALTPLARTFPSWTGIFTGEYPKVTGIRSNLDDQQTLNLTNSLPAILERNHYHTIFATDETRFSNIDKNFGFNQIVSPPMGLNDFLLGTFNDFPLSNLLINTAIGKYLFPYSYANRPVYFAYDPNSFLKLLQSQLPTKRTQPLFLTVHFCLTHAPYLWAAQTGDDVGVLERYRLSIERVDQQLANLFAILERYQLLHHAIIILLSDHGEGLELSGDRITAKDLFMSKAAIPNFYPPSLDHEAVDQSVGHGTDVLGLSQYHTLLAFKSIGTVALPQKMILGIVSLLDIKPTLLQLLKITAPAENGISLMPLMASNAQESTLSSPIFLESDYSPVSIRTVYPETSQVVLEGIQLFRVNPLTTRLTVRRSMETMIIKSKQFAEIYGDWVLALYPQNKKMHTPILVNLQTGDWTDDLHSAFAQKSPVKLMLSKLKSFYGNEISDI